MNRWVIELSGLQDQSILKSDIVRREFEVVVDLNSPQCKVEMKCVI